MNVKFNDARELVAGRMREYCEHKVNRINSSVPYSRLSGRSGRTTYRRGHQRHTHDVARLERPATLLGRGNDDLHVLAQEDANKGATP